MKKMNALAMFDGLDPKQVGLAVIKAIEDQIMEKVQGTVTEMVAPVIDNLSGRIGSLEEQFLYEELTRAQQREMQRMVGDTAFKFAQEDGKTVKQHYANIYGGLKDKYDVPRYTDIPRCKFLEAMATVRQYDGTGKHYWRQH